MSHLVKQPRALLRGVLGATATLACVIGLTVFASGASARPAVAPASSSPATISGTPQVGQTLTASNGTWTGTTPISYGYVWERCDATGGSCSSISGATDQTYLLKSPDNGNTLRVKVTATNADGNQSSTSVPTAVVQAASTTTTTATTTTTTTSTTPAANGCGSTGGTIPIASISSPAHLTIDQTQISPSPITYATRTLTARFHVSACGGSVQGALVYVTAVPYGQFAIPNEQATGSDGWATLQFTAQTGFPATHKQQLLVMFVRARKSGEDILGGISSRRLVSFHVKHG